ncbi:MAG: Appr-1-p processing protein [Candidatus Parabeggiatoa sp. nov. 3]|nr:MAG: Appr-1-p processing protein [Gammaproteobacteria bacterium]RKZ68474.1 MAG: Appr-1-p processing protein [Gammaproteobacteria bacterium]RKZ78713.1 MAG: Appr-1-p processing protein [Gammaproteobacteria bacterium]
MEIILCTVEESLAKAWEKFCGDVKNVKIHRGSILDIKCEAVVSPANSFGFMDGGIDALYLDFFGKEIQMIVRQQIYEQHSGELIIGNADIVQTNHNKIPFLIIAPTMRVPMVLHDSVNAYLAARAVFLLVMKGKFMTGKYKDKPISNYVKKIAIPGLGTGVGKIGYNTCAHQVRAAMNDTILNKYKMPQSWAEASERHQLLYSNKLKRLQY